MAFQVNSGNNGGGRSDTRRKSKGLPFLDPDKDLGADKRRIKILWAGDPKEANVHGDWALVTLKLQSVTSGAKRLWTLGGNNPSLDVLLSALGNEASAWKDRELYMWSDNNNPSETPYVRAEVIPADASVQTAAQSAEGM
jgi:hypothetical protein